MEMEQKNKPLVLERRTKSLILENQNVERNTSLLFHPDSHCKKTYKLINLSTYKLPVFSIEVSKKNQQQCNYSIIFSIFVTNYSGRLIISSKKIKGFT